MWLPYTSYIENLKKKRRENPYYRQANEQQKKIAQPWQELSDIMQNKSNDGSITDYALTDAMIKSQGTFANLQRDIFNQADDKTLQRNEMIDDQIAKYQSENERYQKQQEEIEKEKKRLEKEKKNDWWQVGAEALGTGIGYAVAGPIGGAIGSGVANMASSIFTNRPQTFGQGIKDTFSAFNSMSILDSEKKFYQDLESIDYDNLDKKDLGLLIGIINSGNDELLDKFLKNKSKNIFKPVNTEPLGSNEIFDYIYNG
jgi:hypothetical protein